MHASYLLGALGVLADLSTAAAVPYSRVCHHLPSDPQWPSHDQWKWLNESIGGRLIRGDPLANACHGVEYNHSACAVLQENWADTPLYFEDPVNIMSPYWLSDSCSPFTPRNSTCTLGNIAPYAINVTSAHDIAAGLKFAQSHNIRLTVKNTGHDFLGRSAGAGSLALWTHNLKDIHFFNYSSPGYSGPAVKLGAGVQGFEVYQQAAANGYRITGGSCPTVGIVGGYVQGGGHGALQGAYGLAADNTLEFEVVIPDGRQLVVSPTENEDLYWALNGGGGGTYAVVVSQSIKAHVDGIVAGASLAFSAHTQDGDSNSNNRAYWAAIEAWHKQLLVYDGIPGLTTFFGFTADQFNLYAATLPGSSASAIAAVLQPFIKKLDRLGLNYSQETNDKPTYYDHFTFYNPGLPYGPFSTNSTIGGRLIPRHTVRENLQVLLAAFRNITSLPGYRINGIASNITHARVGNAPGSNAVVPAWRDALYSLNMDVYFDPAAPMRVVQGQQAQMNRNQDILKALTPGGGTYMNEATFDNPGWKEDYFGPNYPRLLEVKKKYDPSYVLYGPASVGSDHWSVAPDGRLCVAD